MPATLERRAALRGIPAVPNSSKASPVDRVLVKDTRHVKQKSLAFAALDTRYVNAIIMVSLCVLHQGLHAHLPSPAAGRARVRANVRIFICYAIDRHCFVETGEHGPRLHMKKARVAPHDSDAKDGLAQPTPWQMGETGLEPVAF
jgi:hypothetical protein